MIGGLKSSRFAIAAAAGFLVGGLTLTPAQAADLGGDCCADLEERVAELEATTVRHANRKISLTLSGQVNQELLWYDNGEESDVYLIDNDEASTRLNLKGSGVIQPGVSAGFQIEVDLQMGNNFSIKENDDDDGDTFQFRRAEWWVKSDQLGTVTLGQGSQASDGAFEVSFSNAWLGGVGYGLAITNTYFTVFDKTSNSYTGATWGGIGTDLDGSRRNRIRYDSPTLAGFTMSTSWGEDDFWDVAVRYANEFNGIRVAAAASYLEDQDDEGNRFLFTIPASASANRPAGTLGASCSEFGNNANNTVVTGNAGNGGGGCVEVETWGGSIAFQHVATGMHVEGGYSLKESNARQFAVGTMRLANVAVPAGAPTVASFGTINSTQADDFEHWWVAAGVSMNVVSLGATDVSIQYIHNESSSQWVCDSTGACGSAQAAASTITSTSNIEYTNWGIGLGQDIDAIGANFYLSYLHHEAEANGVNANLDAEFDQINAGMRVRY